MFKGSAFKVLLTSFLIITLTGFGIIVNNTVSNSIASTYSAESIHSAEFTANVVKVARVDNLVGYSTGGITWEYSNAKNAEHENTLLEYRVLKNDKWSNWESVEEEKSLSGKKGASEFIVFGNVKSIEARIGSESEIKDFKINATNADEPSALATDRLTNGASANGDSANGESTEDAEASSSNSLRSAPLTSSTSQTVKAGAREPAICDRACWGANESWMRWNPQIIEYRGAVIHHTAGSNDYTKSESAGIVRSIYSYHANNLGWGDIGYNFLVDKYGQIFEGRWLSRYHQVQGAHAYGANEYTFGVSALGNYETAQPTAALLDAFASIISWKFSVYDIDPRGYANIGTESQGVKWLPTILGHRDVGATACPGKNLYAKLTDLKLLIQSDYGVGGAIGNKWMALGAAGGRMGFPTSEEIPDGNGQAQTFQGGNIYWKKSTGDTHPTWGAIKSKYNSMTARYGVLGYPTSDELNLAKGAAQTFDGGNIYWNKSTKKTFSVIGLIKKAYSAKNGASGPAGFPKSDEMAGSKGLGQIFDNGKIFLQDGSSKAYWAHDAIGNLYDALGSRGGKLGYPITDEIKTSSYTYQKFENGEIRWTQARDAWVVY
ncbi:MAG: N-acetylmuramoyl-L-alanine amidase [Bifidobacteriaceae bacterium]|jgi:uncharacterized protein with LGFP repeats|nr:N-acetylmuramoyl-L-alanine amidase [Bifidobacteriaceae bacterium]